MSLDVNLYRNRLEAYKVGGKEGRIDSIKHQILNDFYNNPSYFKVLINNIERDVHVVTDNQGKYKILCKPNEIINVGDYVTWNNKRFLCTSINEDDSVQSSGLIQLCNYTIKWIDNANTLIQKPCIVSAKTLYTTGVRDEKVIEIPNGMVGIQLPYDEDTKNLNREQGFVFNKTKYKITFYNEVEFDGLIILLCSEIGFNTSVDDMENEIADRWIDGVDRLSPSEPNPDEPVGFTYFIDGTDSITWNQTKTFTAHKYNNGVEVDGVFTFELIGDCADIITSTDNTIDIKAKNNVYGYVTLKVTDAETSDVLEKQILIKGLI